jgi:hypothetical protein
MGVLFRPATPYLNSQALWHAISAQFARKSASFRDAQLL